MVAHKHNREDKHLWAAINRLSPPVLIALAPWLFMLNAPLDTINAAARALIKGGVLAGFKRLLQLAPAYARENLSAFASRVAGDVLWQRAPTEEAWGHAVELVDKFAADSTAVSASGAFLAYILAVLLARADAAGRIHAVFLETKREIFGFGEAQWEFRPAAVTPTALEQLVAASGLLYNSGCQRPADFVAAVARCLRDHPAQTPALTAAMDQLGHFSWTPTPPPAPAATLPAANRPAYPSTSTSAPAPAHEQKERRETVSCLGCLGCRR